MKYLKEKTGFFDYIKNKKKINQKSFLLISEILEFEKNNEGMLEKYLSKKNKKEIYNKCLDHLLNVNPYDLDVVLFSLKMNGLSIVDSVIKKENELKTPTMGSYMNFLKSIFDKNKEQVMNEAIKRSEYLRKLNNLSIVEQYSYATAPIDSRDEEGEMKLIEWSKMHNEGVKIDWTTEKDYWMPEEHYHSKAEELFDYERKLKLLTVYRWLIQRFPDNYQGLEEATEHHEFLNSNVERILQELVKTREIKGSGAGVKMKKNQRSQIKKIV